MVMFFMFFPPLYITPQNLKKKSQESFLFYLKTFRYILSNRSASDSQIPLAKQSMSSPVPASEMLTPISGEKLLQDGLCSHELQN
jgi:uncharacterized protein YecE (DUF72 family)